MPKATTEVRTIDGYRIVIAYDEQMEFPAYPIVILQPGVHITVYRPDPVGGADDHLWARVLAHAYPGERGQRAAARKAWIERCVHAVLSVAGAPASSDAPATPRLSPGVYSTGRPPWLYLLTHPCPASGWALAARVIAERGTVQGEELVDVARLAPVQEITSSAWMRAIAGYRAPAGTRRDLDHIAGCLLGGAVGDALGARGAHASGAAGATAGEISWHTPITLFTVEGLLRAHRRLEEKGIGDTVGVVLRAYHRWLTTQGEMAPGGENVDGWLVSHPALAARSGTSATVLAALASGRRGTPQEPINDSAGAGAIGRGAAVALMGARDPFALGVELAALTHGHPTAHLACGCWALAVSMALDGTAEAAIWQATSDALRARPGHEACLRAVEQAASLARRGPPTAEVVERLGAGSVAHEALAIGLYCGLAAVGVEDGLHAATAHRGNRRLTGALVGQLLGARLGQGAIPEAWRASLPVRGVIAELARDLFLEVGDAPHAAWFRAAWEKYPGW